MLLVDRGPAEVATVIAWAKENKDVIEREWIRVDE